MNTQLIAHMQAYDCRDPHAKDLKMILGHVDSFESGVITGWIMDPEAPEPSRALMIFINNRSILVPCTPTSRPDVAKHLGISEENVGFTCGLHGHIDDIISIIMHLSQDDPFSVELGLPGNAGRVKTREKMTTRQIIRQVFHLHSFSSFDSWNSLPICLIKLKYFLQHGVDATIVKNLPPSEQEVAMLARSMLAGNVYQSCIALSAFYKSYLRDDETFSLLTFCCEWLLSGSGRSRLSMAVRTPWRVVVGVARKATEEFALPSVCYGLNRLANVRHLMEIPCGNNRNSIVDIFTVKTPDLEALAPRRAFFISGTNGVTDDGLPPIHLFSAALDSQSSTHFELPLPQPEARISASWDPMPLKVAVVIPVYNGVHLLAGLKEDIEPYLGALSQIVIGNDGSDSKTTAFLSNLSIEWSERTDIQVLHHAVNLGFVGNVNTCYRSVRPDVDLVLLLNTDTRLPNGWLQRMLQPFLADETVALATPFATNGANLTITIPKGMTWRRVDQLLSKFPRTFPNACTAIGYCMGVRTSVFPTDCDLFDPVFINGYGDDSDLHFRCLKKGKRSVVVDNLLIDHVGGESFALVDHRDQFIRSNRGEFFRRWSSEYIADSLEFDRLNLVPKHQSVLEKFDCKVDILFVLPSLEAGYGGINVVLKLAEFLANRGMDVAIVSLHSDIGSPQKRWCTAISGVEEAVRSLFSVGAVISTSWDTAFDARALASHFHSRHFALVQGPEAAFSSGQFADLSRFQLSDAETLFCVSSFLESYIHRVAPGHQDVINLQLGPSHWQFYPRDVERRPRSLAISLNTTPEKAAGISVLAALQLSKRGWEIHAFGTGTKDANLPKSFRLHPSLRPNELATLFSKVEFYFDSSIYEGLGLLPIEAAFCGAIPVTTRNGGSDSVFLGGDQAERLTFSGIGDLDAIVDRLDGLDEPEKAAYRMRLAGLPERVNQEKAFERFLAEIQLRLQ